MSTASLKHPPFQTLIAADELAEIIDHCIVVDCRHELTDPAAGRSAYSEGHIPGAHFLHLDEDLAAPLTGSNGRHPLPNQHDFAAKMASIGLTPNTQLIAYDAAGGMVASRLWWMARWIGHSAVAVLDGGIGGWQKAGFPLSRETPRPTPTPAAQVTSQNQATVTATQLLDNIQARSWLVVDARAKARFTGETEPMDARAGHIPGAINRPFADNLREDGRFKPAPVIEAEFLALLDGQAPEKVVHSCGSGVSACHNLLAMAYAGLDGGQLYPGSWSEWSSDPDRPVETGPASA
ncbi:MAG: sulfurtransferase [Burkholderiaceae bacterium]